ncbi:MULTISPECIES: hypothetical protein [unclassified Pseudomonas]|jgi:hypothetical protein|uniref:hypothetical protein n=1 Tax=unclassified Pseudomonas TaxID=196821 RepID=UPI001CF95349|nr:MULTISPECIES: hypothetical protein [unclassified Pseudomonas]WLH78971.1 hypothetical protein PSH81_25180 [Pseudomonas sp. FP2335]
MPSLITIAQAPVSGFSSGNQPKIYNAVPPGSFFTGPQTLPVVSINIRYLVLYHLLDIDTRINDTITYYLYPVPSAGFPTVTVITTLLTPALLQAFITNKREHYEAEVRFKFGLPGIYDIYFEQTNASGTYTVISQNLRFTVV